MADQKTLSVTRLVRRMRNLLEIELGEIWVEGEVSNLRNQASGHLYFTLKDEGAQISCVLFRGNARYCKVLPDNGMRVKLFGEVSVYEARGSLQLIVKKVENAGEGELQAKFEALKRKLAAEGLFDQDKKKPLPSFPTKIGIVSSPSGAALQDMLNVLSRRAPWVKPFLYPVQVQGIGAEVGISNALRRWSEREKYNLPDVDLIIVGRGGGSLEDLWNFNEEIVARAIAGCPIPIISAVGHEIDFTISDFVADMRAPTPSAAAELAVPDREELENRLLRLKSNMNRVAVNEWQRYQGVLQSMRRGALSRSPEKVLREPLQRIIQVRRELDQQTQSQIHQQVTHLSQLSLRLNAHSPEKSLERKAEQLHSLKQKLETAAQEQFRKRERKLENLNNMLRTLGPASVFARGFSVTLTQNGKLVTSEKSLKKGDKLITKFAEGEAQSEVI